MNVPLTGVGFYVAADDSKSTFNFPLIRTDTGWDTIIHLVNASGVPATAGMVFHDQAGVARPIRAIVLPAWGSVDFDPQIDPAIGPNFIGSTSVSATSPIALSIDVLNEAFTENVDSYH